MEPWPYLRDVLTRMAELDDGPDGEAPHDDDLRTLLPDRWIATHPDARLPVNR